MKRPEINATSIILILTASLFASNFIFMKIAMRELAPLVLASVRLVITGVVLLLVAVKVEGGVRIPRPLWLKLALIAVVGTFLYQNLFIRGLSMTTASNTSLIMQSGTVLSTLYALIRRIEKLSARLILGIALGFAGVLLTIVGKEAGFHFAFATSKGDLLLLAGMFLITYNNFISKELLQKVEPIKFMGYTNLIGGLLLAATSGKAIVTTDWLHLSWQTWGAFAYAVLPGSCLAFALWAIALKRVGVVRSSVYMYLQPVVAIVLGILVLGERLSWLQILGAAVIVSSIALVHQRTAPPELPPDEPAMG